MLTRVIRVSPFSPERKTILEAAEALKKGGLVIFPTETVYGIAANAQDPAALEKLYAIKGRPKDKPLSWHIADAGQLRGEAVDFSPRLEEFLAAFWPGPLTAVVATRSGGKTGFRMPDHPVALALIRESGVPVVAPSANLSGEKPPATVAEALKDLDGKVEMALDAGPTRLGKESTVLDMTETPPKVLREGAVSRERLDQWFREHGWIK